MADPAATQANAENAAKSDPTANQAKSDPTADPADGMPWSCKLVGQILSGSAAITAFISGIVVCISFSPLCILAGILLILTSLILFLFEVPRCWRSMSFMNPVVDFAENRTLLQKAIIFIILAIVPLALCLSSSTGVACGLVFAVGVFYCFMNFQQQTDREKKKENGASSAGVTPLSKRREEHDRVGLLDKKSNSTGSSGNAKLTSKANK